MPLKKNLLQKEPVYEVVFHDVSFWMSPARPETTSALGWGRKHPKLIKMDGAAMERKQAIPTRAYGFTPARSSASASQPRLSRSSGTFER